MSKMPIISLPDTAKALGESGGRVNVLWQQPDSLVFMARGREYRSEFHINPSDEVMYPVKGDLKLHYRTEDGKEEIADVPEGSVIYTPAGTPHSPRFAPDAYLLVVERKRREGEVDRFQWFCPIVRRAAARGKGRGRRLQERSGVEGLPASSSTAKKSAPARSAAT